MNIKHLISRTLCLTFVLSVFPQAQAQVFKITPGTRDPGSPLNQAQFEAFLQQLEDEVNSGLPSVETGEYTKGMANAAAMASSGTAAVYGSSFTYGLVGVSGSLGVDLGEGNSLTNFDSKKVAGFGAQAAAVVGFNPGAFASGNWGFVDPSRLRLFVSFLKMDRTVDAAEVSFSNFGFIGQYRLMPEQSLGMNLVKWNGVDVSTGLRYSKMKATFTEQLDVTFSDGGVNANVEGPALIGADVGIFSIPVEVSTSVRLAYVFNLIAGLGMDLNFGSSESIANYASDITLSDNSTATGDLDLGSKASPTMINARGFLGVGFEFAVGTLNLTVGKSLTAGAWGVNAGLNFFF